MVWSFLVIFMVAGSCHPNGFWVIFGIFVIVVFGTTVRDNHFLKDVFVCRQKMPSDGDILAQMIKNDHFLTTARNKLNFWGYFNRFLLIFRYKNLDLIFMAFWWRLFARRIKNDGFLVRGTDGGRHFWSAGKKWPLWLRFFRDSARTRNGFRFEKFSFNFLLGNFRPFCDSPDRT